MKFPRTFATPTPFDEKRAREIYAQRGIQGAVDHAMTDGEDEYVHQLWKTMRGTTCWQDAFLRILHAGREVSWGHWGITFVKRGVGGRDDMWQASFAVGVQGPCDGTIGSPEREAWIRICREWMDEGKLPDGAREIRFGHSKWSGGQWVNCDCGARYVQDCTEPTS